MSVAKDNANSLTLLEYALSCLAASDDPSLRLGVRLPDELAPLRLAKVKIEDVRSSMQKLQSEARELESAAKGGGGSEGAAVAGGGGGGGGAVDPFAMRMARFAEQAATETARLSSLLARLEARYVELNQWLKAKMKPPASAGGLERPPMESDELFATFVEFADAVKASLPKPKPPARNQSALAAAPRAAPAEGGEAAAAAAGGRRAGGGGGAEAADPRKNLAAAIAAEAAEKELDPMTSRMRRLQPGANAAAATPASPGRGNTAGGNAAGGGAAVNRPSRALSQAKLAKQQSVDRKLQERLAKRFETVTTGGGKSGKLRD